MDDLCGSGMWIDISLKLMGMEYLCNLVEKIILPSFSYLFLPPILESRAQIPIMYGQMTGS